MSSFSNCSDWKWIVHPLSILTCSGNGRGGGDYDDGNSYVGIWAGDEIGIEETAPINFEEITPNFVSFNFAITEKVIIKKIANKYFVYCDLHGSKNLIHYSTLCRFFKKINIDEESTRENVTNFKGIVSEEIFYFTKRKDAVQYVENCITPLLMADKLSKS